MRTALRLSASLGLKSCPAAAEGDALPFPWNWLYFIEPAAKSEVGPDGHPKRGGFLPPIEHPRRMWAGSRCSFMAPLQAGRLARKTSTIKSVTEKSGRAGPMVFVTVEHEIESGGALSMREEQDIVYMDIPETFRPPPAQPLPECGHSEHVDIDPVLLFRFSALTFNGHRIHYDRRYAMDVEKYPGLVVHGPLQAILLYEFGTRIASGRTPSGFQFRGVHPLFDFDTVSLNACENEDGDLDLFTANGDGTVCMKALLAFGTS